MLRLIITILIICMVGFLIWFGLTRMPWVQQSRFSFLAITMINTVVVLLISIVLIGLHFEFRAAPEPKITYGEFPFRLEYEVEGQRHTIENTVVVEFVGSFRGNMTTPASRRWSMSLLNESVDKEIEQGYRFLLKEVGEVRIVFSPGQAAYFMGDPKPIESSLDPDASLIRFGPNISIRNPDNESLVTTIRVEEAHELLSEYGITIINWKYTPPIENRFL